MRDQKILYTFLNRTGVWQTPNELWLKEGRNRFWSHGQGAKNSRINTLLARLVSTLNFNVVYVVLAYGRCVQYISFFRSIGWHVAITLSRRMCNATCTYIFDILDPCALCVLILWFVFVSFDDMSSQHCNFSGLHLVWLGLLCQIGQKGCSWT